jgi:hypothetical protein
MFGFPQPAEAQTVGTPCPCCGTDRAVPVYATALRQFFRCVRCTNTWAVTVSGSDGSSGAG